MKKLLILLVLVDFAFSAQWNPSVASRDTINYYCDTLATEGDTINIPADTVSWSSSVIITKCLFLLGSGIDTTIIDSDIDPPGPSNSGEEDNFLIVFKPDTPDSTKLFRLSNLTVDCDSVSSGIYLYNPDTSNIAYARIDHIKLINDYIADGSAERAIVTSNVYGVIDNNTFDNNPGRFSGYGLNTESWENIQFIPGSKYNIYYEDNTFTNIRPAPFNGGVGGRYCVRYCDFFYESTTDGMYPLFDMHGNQEIGNYAQMGAEMYGNEYTSTYNKGCGIVDQRGGIAMVWGNNIITTGSTTSIVREEFADSLYPAPNNYLMHANSSYYWNNTKNGGGNITTYESSDCCDAIAENSEFWNYDASFDGTTGMGVGLYAAMPATCTTGVGYWATDKGGDWNKSNEYENDGALYKATATNTWTLYYTPYEYPHPLRGENPSEEEEQQASQKKTDVVEVK